jgi:translation initiation factor 4B
VSEAGSDRGERRRFEGDGKVRDFGNWERKGPLSPSGPVREGGRPRSNEGSGFRRTSPAWGEGRSQDGSRPPRRDFQERPERPERAERAPTAAELDNQWRARMRPDPPKEPSNPPSPVAAPALAVRPKLNLQKRTVSETEPSPAAPRAGDSKASPFGAARPIDTAAREKEIEEKRERQRKEAEERAKAEKAERAEKQRLAKEQAKEAKAEKAAAADANGSKEAVSDAPQAKSFEILRRAAEEEDATTADDQPEEPAQKPTSAESTGKQTPADAPASKSNGDWRNNPAPAAEADEEGWSTVSSKPRGGRRGGGRGSA